MEPEHFDGLVRVLARPASRRRTLGVLVSAAAALQGGALALLAEAAPGRSKRRRRNRGGKHRPQANSRPRCPKSSRCGRTCCPTPDHGTTTCTKGKCDVSCDAGYTECGSTCVDPDTLCGGLCGNVCTGGTTCCGFSCVDTSSDNAYCGSCTQRCGTGTSCASGSCAPDACGACRQYTSETPECFWLDCHTGSCCWVPISQYSDQAACEAQDKCSTPGGACYKWGTVSCTASA